jgi:ABC-type nitrate/sulfonate/bicarbonate transport system substrate-binding protein
MENHVYASWDTPIEKAILSAIAKADGGSYDKIKAVPNTVTDVVAALQTDVDMVWVYYAWDGIATELAGLKTNFINFGQVNPALDFYTPVLASSNDYLAKNPDVARKFLAATAKGYEYAISNPAEAAAILVKNAPGMDIKLAEKSQEWLKDQYKAEVANWGQIDTARWDRFYTWMYDNALIKKKIGSGEGFTNDYLPN